MSKNKVANEEMKIDIDDLQNNADTQDGDLEEPETKEDSSTEEQSKNEVSEEKLKEEEELNVRYLRLAADFQNYKRRAEKEKSDIYAYANEKIVLELLDVIDNFERALEHSIGSIDSIREGMTMIFKQLNGVLERSGTEEILALGEQFDPNIHCAILTEKSHEYESGIVIQVLQKGYMLNKKIIRPAMVKVAE